MIKIKYLLITVALVIVGSNLSASQQNRSRSTINSGKTPTPIGAILIKNGIGIYIRSLDIDFYSDTTDTENRGFGTSSIAQTVRIVDNDGFTIENKEERYPWFNVMFEHHYGSEMVCVGETNNYFKILVNNSGLCYWIRKNRYIELKKIDNYLKSFYGINIKVKQPIYTNPTPNSNIIAYRGSVVSDSFNIVQVKGDWIEIRSSLLKSGWIKWCNGNNILVDFIDSM